MIARNKTDNAPTCLSIALTLGACSPFFECISHLSPVFCVFGIFCQTKKDRLEVHSVRKCASAIFVRPTSDISSMRYAASRAIYGLRRVEEHEYNIAKADSFYIAFAARQKYRCKHGLQYHLYVPKTNLFFRKVLPFSKYVTHYDTFNF